MAGNALKDDHRGIVAHVIAWCETDKANPRVEVRIDTEVNNDNIHKRGLHDRLGAVSR